MGGIKEALVFPGCADFQPLAYVQGLAKAVEKLGGRIFENTRVMNTDKTYVRARATQHPTRAPAAAAMCSWRFSRALLVKHSPGRCNTRHGAEEDLWRQTACWQSAPQVF